jgi:hypothetical protein
MKAIYIQKALALIFILLGGWCVLDANTVESLVLLPEYYVGNATTQLFLGCFGAQAVLVGIVIWTSVFQPRTFLIFGTFGSIPFFAFNYYFYFVEQMFTEWMLLDFAGNTGIFLSGVFGYKLSKAELESKTV